MKLLPLLSLLAFLAACSSIRIAQEERRLVERTRDAEKAFQQGDYRLAAEEWQSALELARRRGREGSAAGVLINLARVDEALGDYERSLDRGDEALEIARAIGSEPVEARALNQIGLAQRRLARLDDAKQTLTRALDLARRTDDVSLQGNVLRNIGAVAQIEGRSDMARRNYEESLAAASAAGDTASQASTLNDWGGLDRALADYGEALQHYEKALALRRTLGNPLGEAKVLGNICLVDVNLNRPEAALANCEKSLRLARKLDAKALEANNLHNLGAVHAQLGELPKAVTLYEQSLTIKNTLSDRPGAARDLAELGQLHRQLGQYDEARSHLQRALDIQTQVGDRRGQAASLQALASLAADQGRYDEAKERFRDVALMASEIGAPELLWRASDGLSRLHAAQEERPLAIFYGKRAVNTIQSIRRTLLGLPEESQTTFLRPKADAYRRLANLLIEEGRLPEAEQVLGLLKEDEYLEFVRGNSNAAPAEGKADLTHAEAQYERQYSTHIENAGTLSREREALRKKLRETDSLSDEERIRWKQLDVELARLQREFDTFLADLEHGAASRELAKEKLEQVREAQGLMETLRTLGPGVVALFTLVDENKYSVFLVTSEIRQAAKYDIPTGVLNKKIFDFREVLQNPRRDPRPLARDLYDIIVAPLETTLEGLHAHTLMWSLDGVLRYLPISALYDGQHYLVERYRNVVITKASESRLTTAPQPEWKGLGLGVSKAHPPFGALPAVVAELHRLIREERDGQVEGGVLPGTLMLDEQFTKDSMETALLPARYALVHIASHFDLKPGDDTNSSLLLGDGSQLSLAQINASTNYFSGVDLLSLSACNTAVAAQGANGVEVDAFAVIAQQQGAMAVLASLWPVADASTSLLMEEFYRQRQTARVSKAEALQRAQLHLLRGDAPAVGGTPAVRGATEVLEDAFPLDPAAPYAHPYYWAPFILIGNWK